MSDPPCNRDRKIADTGWGIKPDDQPSNTTEAGNTVQRSYRYDPAEADVIRRVLLAQRRAFNTANRVRVEPATADRPGRTIIFDINKDAFTVEGLSFGDPNLIELLERLGAAFDAPELRRLTRDEANARDFALTRAWAWGAERSGG